MTTSKRWRDNPWFWPLVVYTGLIILVTTGTAVALILSTATN